MQQTTNPVVATFKRKSKLRTVINISILSLAGVLFIVVIVTLLVKHFHHNQVAVTGNVCSTAKYEPILEQAQSVMSSNSTDEQQQVVARIFNIPGYNHDPDCLFFVTEYYANVSNAQAASSYLKQFEAAYDKREISDSIVNPQSVSNIKELVNSAQSNANSSQPLVVPKPSTK